MTGSLRIGVNALFLIPGGVGGAEIYLRNLLAALAAVDSRDQFFVFINTETAAAEPALVPAAPNFHVVRCPLRAASRPARLLWEQLVLPMQCAARRLDVLFSPGFTSPLVCAARKVTVIHDLQHARQPENFGRIERAAWQAAVWLSARFSSCILTVSEASRRDILEIYGLSPDRVRVVRHGVEAGLLGLEPRNSERPYLLSVSTIHAHKNWARWLEAFERLAAEGFPHDLVIAGLRGKYTDQLERLIDARGLRQRVRLAGWVPRAELIELYAAATALVFPSTFEGFGLPVLEAMAAGLPVACSDIAPLREIAEDAALFFDPISSDSIADAVRRLLVDAELRRRLTQRGSEIAAGFSWNRAAEETLASLRQVAAPSR